MKILLAVRSLNVGGTERQVIALARALTAKNCDVHIAVISSGGELESEIRDDTQIEFHVLGGPSFSRFTSFRRLVKCQRYDAVYGFLPNMNLLLLGAKVMRHRPLIAWGVRSANLDLTMYPRSVRLAYRLEKATSRFADIIITNSKAAEVEYRSRGYNTRQIVSIPNAIDTVRFAPVQTVKKSVISELDVPSDSKLIGIFGRAHPTKDHQTFLTAAGRLLKKRSDVHFLVVGGASPGLEPYRRGLQVSSESMLHGSNIHWLGQQLDPEYFMAACDLTTLTSIAEGFPNAIAESMACGTPVVSTDVGDAAAIIGHTGKVVPSQDPQALAETWEGMLGLPENELRSLGQQARTSIIERYSPAQIAARTIQALGGHQVIET